MPYSHQGVVELHFFTLCFRSLKIRSWLVGCYHLNNLVAGRALGEMQASYCIGLPWSLQKERPRPHGNLQCFSKFAFVGLPLRCFKEFIPFWWCKEWWWHSLFSSTTAWWRICLAKQDCTFIPFLLFHIKLDLKNVCPRLKLLILPFIVISLLSFNISLDRCGKLCCFFCQSLSQNLNLKRKLKAIFCSIFFLGATFVMFWHTTYIVLRYFLQCFMLTFL